VFEIAQSYPLLFGLGALAIAAALALDVAANFVARARRA
jgi:hypothetical protein